MGHLGIGIAWNVENELIEALKFSCGLFFPLSPLLFVSIYVYELMDAIDSKVFS